jgi:2-dehydropantoate 2-reductase
MRVTIVGAGGIGGTIGAHMARAGHEVTFVEVNASHVQAMREHGLHVAGMTDLLIKPETLFPEEVGGLDAVLLAVKAPATAEALAIIAPRLSERGYVASLQNGFEAYKVAAGIGAGRTIAAELTIGALYRGPGEIFYSGPGSFRLGELDGSDTDRVHELAAGLAAVVPVAVTSNIRGYLWGKAALGAVWFATALVDEDVPRILARPEYLPVLGRLAAEVVSVADAEGVICEPIDGFDAHVFGADPVDEVMVAAAWEGQRSSWSRYLEKRTGVWRDLAVRHRATEVEALLAPVVSRADWHHMAVPRLRELVALIKEAEQGIRQLGWANLDDLRRVDALHPTTG